MLLVERNDIARECQLSLLQDSSSMHGYWSRPCIVHHFTTGRHNERLVAGTVATNLLNVDYGKVDFRGVG